MARIDVKTVEGRVAFDAPRGGRQIPTDRYVAVEHTRYIDRLINVWGDIVVRPRSKEAAKEPPTTETVPAIPVAEVAAPVATPTVKK